MAHYLGLRLAFEDGVFRVSVDDNRIKALEALLDEILERGTLVPADKVKITGELVEANPPNFCGGYDETKGVMPQGFSKRKSCAKCYGCVLNDHSHTDAKMVDICGGLIDWGEKGFQPAMHINYANAMFKIKDGKPKFKDFPTEFGGTGEIIPAASSMWGVWDKE